MHQGSDKGLENPMLGEVGSSGCYIINAPRPSRQGFEKPRESGQNYEKGFKKRSQENRRRRVALPCSLPEWIMLRTLVLVGDWGKCGGPQIASLSAHQDHMGRVG
jgi:hypothetical protein